MTGLLEGAAGLAMPDPLEPATPAVPDVEIRPESPADEAAIERLAEAAFGPGRYARTAYRIREAGRHDPALSFVAVAPGGAPVASVRMSRILIGAERAWLLGPLVVAPALARRGIGRALVRRAVAAADAAGGAPVLLVGDLPYYGPCGFRRVDPAAVRLPGPVEPDRLLLRMAPGDGRAPPRGAVLAADPH